MSLLERVATLVRANLNDLVDRAEDPEKLIKQVIVDMQNQLLQVKTQVAVSMADQHLLEKKRKENEGKAAEWTRRAELAVDKKQDDLARGALERSLAYKQIAESFTQQVEDQAVHVENLKSALRRLEEKLTEAESRSDLIIAQHRRARSLRKASEARNTLGNALHTATFKRMQDKAAREGAVNEALSAMVTDNLDDRFAALTKEDEVERLLAELKARRRTG